MSLDLIGEVALLQLKLQSIQDQSSILSDLGDMQALNKLASDLAHFIDTQKSTQQLPADPLQNLRERASLTAEHLISLRAWREEQTTKIFPSEGTSKESLESQLESRCGDVALLEWSTLMEMTLGAGKANWVVLDKKIQLSKTISYFLPLFRPEITPAHFDDYGSLELRPTVWERSKDRIQVLLERWESQQNAIQQVSLLLNNGDHRSAAQEATDAGLMSSPRKGLYLPASEFKDLHVDNLIGELRALWDLYLEPDALVKKSLMAGSDSPEIALAYATEAQNTILAKATESQGELRQDLETLNQQIDSLILRFREEASEARKRRRKKKEHRTAWVIAAVIMAIAMIIAVAMFMFEKGPDEKRTQGSSDTGENPSTRNAPKDARAKLPGAKEVESLAADIDGAGPAFPEEKSPSVEMPKATKSRPWKFRNKGQEVASLLGVYLGEENYIGVFRSLQSRIFRARIIDLSDSDIEFVLSTLDTLKTSKEHLENVFPELRDME